MFIPNLQVKIEDNKIICLKNRSTPGVYKLYKVKRNTKYNIDLLDFDHGNANKLILWIADLNNNVISVTLIKGIDNIEYENKCHNMVKIGILFRHCKLNDYFYIKNINIEEIKQNIIINKPSPTLISLKSNDITVVIPCHYKHFKHISELLIHYNKQTLLPKEIIIMLCEVNRFHNKNMIDDVQNKKYNFDLKIIKIKNKSAAGNNRYLGTKEAKGNIVIFQDADDIPHKQRLEIMKYFFDKYPDVLHICHKFTKNKSDIKYYDNISKIKHRYLESDIFLDPRKRKPERITNGNIGIRKHIYDNLNWYKNRFRAQDIALNSNIYNKYKKTLIIMEPLYIYRHNLSLVYII